jgi:hypothetical protein
MLDDLDNIAIDVIGDKKIFNSDSLDNIKVTSSLEMAPTQEQAYRMFWDDKKAREEYYIENFADEDMRNMAKAYDYLDMWSKGLIYPTTKAEQEQAVIFGEWMMRGTSKLDETNITVTLAPNANEQGMDAKFNHLSQIIAKKHERKCEFIEALDTDELYNVRKNLNNPIVEEGYDQSVFNNMIYIMGRNFTGLHYDDDGERVVDTELVYADPETFYGHAFTTDTMVDRALNAYTGGSDRAIYDIRDIGGIWSTVRNLAPNSQMIGDINRVKGLNPDSLEKAFHTVHNTEGDEVSYPYYYKKNKDGSKTYYFPIAPDVYEEGWAAPYDNEGRPIISAAPFSANNGRGVSTRRFLQVEEADVSRTLREKKFNKTLFRDKDSLALKSYSSHITNQLSEEGKKFYMLTNRMKGEDKILNQADDSMAQRWSNLSDKDRNALAVLAQFNRLEEYGGSGGFWCTTWDSLLRSPGNMARGVLRGTTYLYDYFTLPEKDAIPMMRSKAVLNNLLDETVVYDKNTGLTAFGANIGESSFTALTFMAGGMASKGLSKGLTVAGGSVAKSTKVGASIANYLNAGTRLANASKFSANALKVALAHMPEASLYALQNIEKRATQALLAHVSDENISEEMSSILTLAAIEGVAVDYLLERIPAAEALSFLSKGGNAAKRALFLSMAEGSTKEFIKNVGMNYARQLGKTVSLELVEEMTTAVVGTPINVLMDQYLDWRLTHDDDDEFTPDWDAVVNTTAEAVAQAATSTIPIAGMTGIGGITTETAAITALRNKIVSLKSYQQAEDTVVQSFLSKRELGNVHRPQYVDTMEADIRNAESALSKSLGRKLDDTEKAAVRKRYIENTARKDMESAYNKWKSFATQEERSAYLESLGFSSNKIAEIERAFDEMFEYRGGTGYAGMMSDSEVSIRETMRGFGIDDSAYNLTVDNKSGDIVIDFTGSGNGVKFTISQNVYESLSDATKRAESEGKSQETSTVEWLDRSLRLINNHKTTTKEDIFRIVDELGFVDIVDKANFASGLTTTPLLTELAKNQVFVQAVEDNLRTVEGLYIRQDATKVDTQGVTSSVKDGTRNILIKKDAVEGSTSVFGHELAHHLWDISSAFNLIDVETRKLVEDTFSKTNADGTKTFNEEAFAEAFSTVFLSRVGLNAEARAQEHRTTKGKMGVVKLALNTLANFVKSMFSISKKVSETGKLKSIQDIVRSFLDDANKMNLSGGESNSRALEGKVKEATAKKYSSEDFASTDTGAKVTAEILDYLFDDAKRVQALFGRRTRKEKNFDSLAEELSDIVLNVKDDYNLNEMQTQSIISAIYESLMRTNYKYSVKGEDNKKTTKSMPLNELYEEKDLTLPKRDVLKQSVGAALVTTLSKRKGGRFDEIHTVAAQHVAEAFVDAHTELEKLEESEIEAFRKKSLELEALSRDLKALLDSGSVPKAELDEANETIERQEEKIKNQAKKLRNQENVLHGSWAVRLENTVEKLQQELDANKEKLRTIKDKEERARKSMEGSQSRLDRARLENEETKRVRKHLQEERQHINDTIHAQQLAMLAVTESRIDEILETLNGAFDTIQSRMKSEYDAQIDALVEMVDDLAESTADKKEENEKLLKAVESLEKSLEKMVVENESQKESKKEMRKERNKTVAELREALRLAKKDLWKHKLQLRSALAEAKKFHPKYVAEHIKRMTEQKAKTKAQNKVKVLLDKLAKRDKRIENLIKRVEETYVRGVEKRKRAVEKGIKLREEAVTKLTETYEKRLADTIIRYSKRLDVADKRYKQYVERAVASLQSKQNRIDELRNEFRADKARMRAYFNEKGIPRSKLNEMLKIDFMSELAYLVGWNGDMMKKAAEAKAKGDDAKTFNAYEGEQGNNYSHVEVFLNKIDDAFDAYIERERPDLYTMGWTETRKDAQTGETVSTNKHTQKTRAYTSTVSSIIKHLSNIVPFSKERMDLTTASQRVLRLNHENARFELLNAILETTRILRMNNNEELKNEAIKGVRKTLSEIKRTYIENRFNREGLKKYLYGFNRIVHRFEKAFNFATGKEGEAKLAARINELERSLGLSSDTRATASEDTDFAVLSETIEDTYEVIDENGKVKTITEKIPLEEKRHYDLVEYHFLTRYGNISTLPVVQAFLLINEASDWMTDYLTRHFEAFQKWMETCEQTSKDLIDDETIDDPSQMHRKGLGWMSLMIPDFFEKLRWNATEKGVEVVDLFERQFSKAARMESYLNETDQALLNKLCASAYGLDADATTDAEIATIANKQWLALREDVKEDYQYFSNIRQDEKDVRQFKNHLSRANLIYIFASLRQEDVRAKFKDRYKHYSEDSDIEGIDVYFSRLCDVLTKEDMQLADNIVYFFTQKREMLSNKTMEMFGVPVFAPVKDYVPLFVNSDRDITSSNYTSFTLYPSMLKQRVFHERGIDETVDLYDVAFGRSRRINRWSAYVDLYRTSRAVLGDRDVNNILAKRIGTANLKALNKQFNDIFNGVRFNAPNKIERGFTVGAATISLASNLKSAIRQFEGMSATRQARAEFGLTNRGAGLFGMISSKQGREAIAKELKGDIVRTRLENGNSLEMRQALNILSDYILTEGKDHKTRRKLTSGFQKFLNTSFIPLKLTDAFSCAVMMASLRPQLVAKWKERGLSDAEAETEAEAELDIAVQKYQQSGRSEYLNAFQRSDSSIVRMLSMFTGPSSVFAGAQLKTLHDLAVGTKAQRKKAWARFRGIMTRVFAYSLINEMLRYFFGDDEEELDDVTARFFLNMTFSSVTGLPILGAIISTATYHGAKMLCDEPNANAHTAWDGIVESTFNVPAVGAWKRYFESCYGVCEGLYQVFAEGDDDAYTTELIKEEAFNNLVEDTGTVFVMRGASDIYKFVRNLTSGKQTKEEKAQLTKDKAKRTRERNKKKEKEEINNL